MTIFLTFTICDWIKISKNLKIGNSNINTLNIFLIFRFRWLSQIITDLPVALNSLLTKRKSLFWEVIFNLFCNTRAQKFFKIYLGLNMSCQCCQITKQHCLFKLSFINLSNYVQNVVLELFFIFIYFNHLVLQSYWIST